MDESTLVKKLIEITTWKRGTHIHDAREVRWILKKIDHTKLDDTQTSEVIICLHRVAIRGNVAQIKEFYKAGFKLNAKMISRESMFYNVALLKEFVRQEVIGPHYKFNVQFTFTLLRHYNPPEVINCLRFLLENGIKFDQFTGVQSMLYKNWPIIVLYMRDSWNLLNIYPDGQIVWIRYHVVIKRRLMKFFNERVKPRLYAPPPDNKPKNPTRNVLITWLKTGSKEFARCYWRTGLEIDFGADKNKFGSLPKCFL